MVLDEVEQVLKSINEKSMSREPTVSKKKRITLKNVQLLKKPDVQEASGSKSKIFIKNVQLLRKPDLPIQNPIPNIFDSIINIQDDFLDEDNSFADDFNHFDAYTSLQVCFKWNTSDH